MTNPEDTTSDDGSYTVEEVLDDIQLIKHRMSRLQSKIDSIVEKPVFKRAKAMLETQSQYANELHALHDVLSEALCEELNEPE